MLETIDIPDLPAAQDGHLTCNVVDQDSDTVLAAALDLTEQASALTHYRCDVESPDGGPFITGRVLCVVLYDGVAIGSWFATLLGEVGVRYASDTPDYSTETAATGNKEEILAAVESSIEGLSGPGADLCTLLITTPQGSPIPDADVWITEDAAGHRVLWGVKQSNSDGEIRVLLDAGASYYLWCQRDGSNDILGQLFTAIADP